jgi:hypothetical protein
VSRRSRQAAPATKIASRTIRFRIQPVFCEEEQASDSCQHALKLINRAAGTAAFPAEHPPRLHLCHGVLDGGTDLAEVRVEFPPLVFKFPAADSLEWSDADADAVDSDVAEVCAVPP